MGSQYSQSRRCWKSDCGGYDGYFILEELYNQHVPNLSQIVNGAKILSLEIPNVKFIDSMTLFSHGIVELSKNIWNPRIKERGFFPISLTLKKIRSM